MEDLLIVKYLYESINRKGILTRVVEFDWKILQHVVNDTIMKTTAL